MTATTAHAAADAGLNRLAHLNKELFAAVAPDIGCASLTNKPGKMFSHITLLKDFRSVGKFGLTENYKTYLVQLKVMDGILASSNQDQAWKYPLAQISVTLAEDDPQMIALMETYQAIVNSLTARGAQVQLIEKDQDESPQRKSQYTTKYTKPYHRY